MKITHSIATTVEGELGEVLNAKLPDVPTLGDVLQNMRNLAFIVETLAHLQGKEAQLLPEANKARLIIYQLYGRSHGDADPRGE